MELEKYFQSFEDYFWEYDTRLSSDSGGEVISIPNTFTIAYEEFIFQILEFLSEDSLPPFGALLLAIIATNQENEHPIEMIKDLAQEKIKLNKATYINTEGEFFRVGAAIDFLKILSSLPAEYKKGEKRLQLFQTIFHNCHKRVSSDKAKKILIEYYENKKNGIKFRNKKPFNLGNFIKDFRTIALLKEKFPTVQELLRAMEDVPKEEVKEQLAEEILEEKEAVENPLDFIEELIQEEKTFHVGSLVKRIWSGLNIPLHHNMPSAQPLGGISDLTNKGDFDKLVISEFANDDDVFMSRIANSEALYIQREVPPEADKFYRILLIDTTLINWGNPKILAFGSAIAIATHPKTDIECKVFVVGNTYKEINLENVNEVITALSELSGKLSCADGLDLFFAENPINQKNQEVFLLSSDESLKVQVMQKSMSEHFNSIKYVFVTNVEGSISIFKNQNKGRKLLQQIIMPLDELWAKKSFKKDPQKDLTNDIPLLYPVDRSYQNIFGSQNDFYTVVNTNLFKFSSNRFDKGFVKIASDLKFGEGTFAFKTNSKGEKILLHHNYGFRRHEIQIMNLSTGILKEHLTQDANINAVNVGVFEYDNEFYFYSEKDFWHIDDDFKLNWLREESIRKAQIDYNKKKHEFENNYKFSKGKYAVIKKLNRVVISDNELRINGYMISGLLFLKDEWPRVLNETLQLEEKVNLILKRRGESVLDLIKLIKNNTNKNLAEAKETVDKDFGVVLQNVGKEEAEELKLTLEKSGAVCYIETQYFQSLDGSKITNQDGILFFESSNTEIEKFYIPFIINMRTAFATEQEFAGNDYFIFDHSQDSMDEKKFKEKYMDPFILHIVNHGV